MSDLIERAVEAAARDQYHRQHKTSGLLWDDASDEMKENWRRAERPIVKSALRVVADHCTTEADALLDDPTVETWDVAFLRDLAVELRETPE